MKKKVAILVGGYYPHFSPIGQVFEKLHESLGKELDMTFLHAARSNDEQESQYKGSRVIPVTCWRHSLWLNKGKCSRITAGLFKLLYYCFCAWRLQTKEEYLGGECLASLERLYREWKFEAIITMAMPFYMHTAARRFKKRHRKVRWITYSADTTIGSETIADCVPIRALRPVFTRRQNAIELNSFRAADFNFMAPEIYRNNRKWFAGFDEKCSPLPYPLFDSDPMVGQRCLRVKPDEISLVYAGGFVPSLREPDYFLKVLAALPLDSKIVWHVFVSGWGAEVIAKFAKRVPDRIVVHDPVSAYESRLIMSNADILVNIGNDSDLFSPSKVYDYISAGRPMVNISYRERKRNHDFDIYPYLLDMENYSNEQMDAVRLDEFCRQNVGRRISSKDVQSLYCSNAPENVAAKIVESLSPVE